MRTAPQLPEPGIEVRQAKELLRRLKWQRRLRLELLADALGADGLPGRVKMPRQTTTGHLITLARVHDAALATADARIPGAFVVPG